MDQPLRIVLDTNVLVAAARSRNGASFALLNTLPEGKWQPCISTALLLEYEEQLKRVAAEQRRPLSEIDAYLDFIASRSIRSPVFYLLRPLPGDADDAFILELAVSAGAAAIITHNEADFRSAARFGIAVLTPRAFWQSYSRIPWPP